MMTRLNKMLTHVPSCFSSLYNIELSNENLTLPSSFTFKTKLRKETVYGTRLCVLQHQDSLGCLFGTPTNMLCDKWKLWLMSLLWEKSASMIRTASNATLRMVSIIKSGINDYMKLYGGQTYFHLINSSQRVKCWCASSATTSCQGHHIRVDLRSQNTFQKSE